MASHYLEIVKLAFLCGATCALLSQVVANHHPADIHPQLFPGGGQTDRAAAAVGQGDGWDRSGRVRSQTGLAAAQRATPELAWPGIGSAAPEWPAGYRAAPGCR